MAGIYIHIPFCRQACHYCDFHFSTNLKNTNEIIDAIDTELHQRRGYIDQQIQTIYFGGGTPSLLDVHHLQKLLDTIYKYFNVSEIAEITLEANPEDLVIDKAKAIKQLGINRLSIGIQTFDDGRLAWMNRIHDSAEAITGYENARSAGFSNISLDLIYALPDGVELWEKDLKQIVHLDPEHISLYGLTIEPRTVFGNWLKHGKLKELAEDNAAAQYLFAIDYLKKNHYVQYEVSNFGKEHYHSRHNMAYWQGVEYLGVGPGAHSYNGLSRQINVSNNAKYLKKITSGMDYFEIETLTPTQRINEIILLSLRTRSGVDLQDLQERFSIDLMDLKQHLIRSYLEQRLMIHENEQLRLTPEGFLVADEIALQLFFQE